MLFRSRIVLKEAYLLPLKPIPSLFISYLNVPPHDRRNQIGLVKVPRKFRLFDHLPDLFDRGDRQDDRYQREEHEDEEDAADTAEHAAHQRVQMAQHRQAEYVTDEVGEHRQHDVSEQKADEKADDVERHRDDRLVEVLGDIRAACGGKDLTADVALHKLLKNFRKVRTRQDLAERILRNARDGRHRQGRCP